MSYGNPEPEVQALFDEAMSRELSEFLESEAACRLRDAAEQQEADTSGRCIPARWLLQWR